jgi:hypothetical protein
MNKEITNEYAQQFLDGMDDESQEFYKEYEEIYSISDLASFIDENWNEITGLENRDKDVEGYFPSEVEEILNELGVDYCDFSDSWGMQREGCGDEYCDNCGAELDGDNELDGNGGCTACCDEDEDEDEDDE